jgi:hypothetical protein
LRSKQILMVLGFSLLVLLGVQSLSSPSAALTITATVDIKPDTLNLNMQGKWITAHVRLPKGYNISDIDLTTIVLQGMLEPEWSTSSGDVGDVLTLKFDASMVVNYLWDRLNHMGLGRASIELTITGQLNDGTDFTGTDTIVIMNPPFAE